VKTILLALIVSCACAPALQQKSYFPIETAPGTDGLTQFESEWYGKSLERMHEPNLLELSKGAKTEIYRFMILPTWGNSIAVRVDKEGELYHLSARRLDGQAGYEPGNLVESKDLDLNAADSKTLSLLLQQLNFSQMTTKETFRGDDGDEWVLEGVSRGSYHVITRWCAESYNPDKRGLKTFLDLCKFLIDKSTISRRPTNKGEKLI
jgi:hypothetical protein